MAHSKDETSGQTEDGLVTVEPKTPDRFKIESQTTRRATELIDEGAQDQRSEETVADDPIPEGPTPTAVTESEQPPQKRGRFSRFMTYMMLLIIAAAAVFGFFQWWYPRMPTMVQGWIPHQLKPPTAGVPQPSLADIPVLEQRLAQAEAGIFALRQEMQTSAPSGDLDSRLSPTMDILAQRITALEAGPDATTNGVRGAGGDADAADLMSLSARLTQVEATTESLVLEQAGAVGFLLSVSQLRDAVTAGQPYTLELETVVALAGRLDGFTIDTGSLSATANSGLPSRAVLQRRFSQVAPAVVRAALLPSDSASWIQRTLDRILSVVNVRQLYDDGGESVGAVVIRIENALADGDLSMAVSIADTLNGLARETATPWLTEARAVYQSEQTIATITNMAIAQIAKGRTGNAPSETNQ